ncbi:MAG: LysR family transcriptional regulator [Bacteroidetes bacterium]|nr:LysR family transcriptional regulator [Bacteroidota bacterium]
MNYTLHQLRIYLKVTQTLSVTKAANELHLTQPAVSMQLKKFQEQFTIPLLEMVNKKIFVTEFGKEIARAAEVILAEVHGIQYKLHQHRGLLTGRLRISVVSTGKYIAPYFLSGFMKQHEGVELMLDVTNKARVIESLEKNEVDFALVSVIPEHLKIEKVELMQNKLFLVGNREQLFPKKEYATKLLQTIPIIYREEGSGTRYVMERFFRRNRLAVTKKMELTSNEAVKQAVIAGLGYSVMPLIGLKNELNEGQLQIVPVKGLPMRSTWNLIWLKEKQALPVAAAYLAYLKKEKANIIRDQFEWCEQY